MSLVKQGWRNCSKSQIKDIDGHKHASLGFRQLRGKRQNDEFWFLRLFVTPDWIQKMINEVFTKNMSEKKERNRQPPPNEREFWLFFARLLLIMVRASPSGHLLQPYYELVNVALNEAMSVRRFNGLRASFHFTHSDFTDAMDHCMQVITTTVRLGRILALDETIAATDGRVARREGMIAYIPHKPHPKGLLIRAICGKFEKSKCVFFVGGRHKHARAGCAPSRTADELVRKLETQSNTNHIILLDGAHSANWFVPPNGRNGKTKYIISVTKSGVSGIYNRLCEACSLFLKVSQHSNLVDPETGVLATLNNSAGRDMAIVTDATSLEVAPPPRPGQKRINQEDFELATAVALLPVRSPEKLVEKLHISLDLTDESKNSMSAFVNQLLGVDILSPVDLSGHVTEHELNQLSKPHLDLIADKYGLKGNTTKTKAIKFILDHHPLAAETRLDQIRPKAKAGRVRKAPPASMSHYELNKKLEQMDVLQRDLLAPGDEPQFHTLYRANYGLHDRFNATLYTCFKFQSASGPFSMMAYLSLIIFAINARAMFAESRHSGEDDMSSPCHTATFCLEVARQIVKRYTDVQIYGDEKFVITDENLLAICSEEAAAQLPKKKSKRS